MEIGNNRIDFWKIKVTRFTSCLLDRCGSKEVARKLLTLGVWDRRAGDISLRLARYL